MQKEVIASINNYKHVHSLRPANLNCNYFQRKEAWTIILYPS